jgi:integrase/recombinase XerD
MLIFDGYSLMENSTRRYHAVQDAPYVIFEGGSPMKRRNLVTNVLAQLALETISSDKLTKSNYQHSVKEFLRHCRIKGLSSETVKFYDKELKQTGRAFAEINAPLSDVRKIKDKSLRTIHRESAKFRSSGHNSRLRAGRTFFNFCLRKNYVTTNPYEAFSNSE